MAFGMGYAEENNINEVIKKENNKTKETSLSFKPRKKSTITFKPNTKNIKNKSQNDASFDVNLSKKSFDINSNKKNNHLSLVQKKTLRMIDELSHLTSSSPEKVNKTREKVIKNIVFAKDFYDKYKNYYLELKAKDQGKILSLIHAEKKLEDIMVNNTNIYVFLYKIKENIYIKKFPVDQFEQMKYFHGVLVEQVDINETPFA